VTVERDGVLAVRDPRHASAQGLFVVERATATASNTSA